LKIAGFLLLLAGWILTLAAIALLANRPWVLVFILAGIVVELIGFILLTLGHRPLRSRNGNL
jgi:hypothetical protein